MALSEELKKIYSSNPVGERYYDTIELSHSRFSKTFYMVQDTDSHSWKLDNGTTVTFEPFPFSIQLPKAGDVQQDISFMFDNVGQVGMPELEAAAELISEPIRLVYRVYIDGYDTPQRAAINLVLTNIVADNISISSVATRPDLYKRNIPTGNKAYFDARFHGLYL